MFGGAIGGAIGAVGSLIGGHYDRESARAQSAADRAWQKTVYQNQYQWKVADAKKAGLHPLAVIGGGAYSASPSSVPSSSSMADSLGKLGEGIGNTFHAYMTKDERAKQAAIADKKEKQADELHDQQIRESASRILMNNAQALSYTKRAASIPMASGTEIVSGQVDARSPHMEKLNKFAWPINPDGSRSDPVPSGDYKEVYEDVPFLEYVPFLDAGYHKWRSILTGRPIDGYRHNWRNNSWSR